MNDITPGIIRTSSQLLLATLIMSVLLLSMAGCQKSEGPVEQVGKKVDQAAEKVGERIQDAAQGDKR